MGNTVAGAAPQSVPVLADKVTKTGEKLRKSLARPEFDSPREATRDMDIRSLLSGITDDSASRSELLRLAGSPAIKANLPAADCLGRYLLLRAAEKALPLLPLLPVTDSIRLLFLREFEFFATPAAGFQDSFDLAKPSFATTAKIATLRRFPAGQLDWEPSGLPRSWLRKVPRKALPGLLSLVILGMKGFAPAFFIHVARHRPGRLVFLEKEVLKSYYRMAKSLELQPAMKAILASAWFYSPEIYQVSPHLEWMHRFFLQNGGWIASMGPATKESGVFSRSPERLEKTKSGEIAPQLGLVIWPRKAAIQWASRHEDLGV